MSPLPVRMMKADALSGTICDRPSTRTRAGRSVIALASRSDLTQANKLSRTYAALVEALNRHRGKGQQKVTVEHVHVHAGGQAVVGAVAAEGGVPSRNQRQHHAQALTYAPVAPLWGENPEREPVRVAGDAERQVPDARGRLTRSTKR